MRLSSSTSDPFAGTYVCPEAAEYGTALSFLGYMLQVEAALAVCAARAGIVSPDDAAAVVAACTPTLLPLSEVEAGLARDATPVIVIVDRLRAAVPPSAKNAVHVGATSQDVVDTANMLYARDVISVIVADSVAIAEALVVIARDHRSAPMAGRTLGQHAVPITVGAWAVLRLRAISDAASHLLEEFGACGCVQYGGAVGMNSALAQELAVELGLRPPVTSWHTSRSNVARIASAAAALAGELGALANDIILLSSTEIAELTVMNAGSSSAMPGKRNASSAVNALACAYRVPGATSTILSMMPQGLQRDPGRWQAEWGAWSDVLQLTASSARHTRTAIEGVDVDADAAKRNVSAILSSLGDEGAARLRDAESVVDRLLGE